MDDFRDRLEQAFRDEFPAQAELASLEFAGLEPIDADNLHVILRLVVWEPKGDSMSIRDVKEQAVHLHLDEFERARFERIVEMIRALVDVVARVLAHADVDYLMPHDICDFSPLTLSRSQTKDDFMRALCKPSRLGKYLPENQRS